MYSNVLLELNKLEDLLESKYSDLNTNKEKLKSLVSKRDSLESEIKCLSDKINAINSSIESLNNSIKVDLESIESYNSLKEQYLNKINGYVEELQNKLNTITSETLVNILRKYANDCSLSYCIRNFETFKKKKLVSLSVEYRDLNNKIHTVKDSKSFNGLLYAIIFAYCKIYDKDFKDFVEANYNLMIESKRFFTCCVSNSDLFCKEMSNVTANNCLCLEYNGNILEVRMPGNTINTFFERLSYLFGVDTFKQLDSLIKIKMEVI